MIVYIVDMEKYDYYTIKAAWKGAGVTQRADDIKAAEKIAADLKGNGFIDVVIFGVKAGKREKLEGGKQAKPKAQERHGKAEKPKAQAKAAPKVKTPVNATKKQEKKAQDNAGQLDLFKQQKKFKIQFTKDELDILRGACHLIGWLPVQNYIDRNEFIILQKTLYDAGLFNDHKIELKNNEIATLCILIEKKMKGEPNPFINEKLEKLRKQLESFII